MENQNEYKGSFLLEGELIDFKGELRLSSLFRLFQNVALKHVNILYDEDKIVNELKLHWVVARYHVEIYRLPHERETITLSTHPSPIRAFFFPRHFLVKDEKGETIIKAGSIWALVDEKARQMVRPVDVNFPDVGYLSGEEVSFPLSYRAKEDEQKETMKAVYSLCDRNGHLNNCSYIDVAMDKIPLSYLKTHSPKTVDIQYKKEILLSEELSLSAHQENDEWDFQNERFSLGIKF